MNYERTKDIYQINLTVFTNRFVITIEIQYVRKKSLEHLNFEKVLDTVKHLPSSSLI